MSIKGVIMNCEVRARSTPNSDTIIVTVRCQDRREGVSAAVKQPKTFLDRAHLFIPAHGEFEFMRAWNKIAGWLVEMELDPCCHPYVIECILNRCSGYNYDNLRKWGSIVLDVNLKIADQYSYVPKQPRLHPRDWDQQQDHEYDYQSDCCDERDWKKFCGPRTEFVSG